MRYNNNNNNIVNRTRTKKKTYNIRNKRTSNSKDASKVGWFCSVTTINDDNLPAKNFNFFKIILLTDL